MGTGGLPTIGHQQTFSLLMLIIYSFSYTLKIAQDISSMSIKKSPRPISNARLKMLPLLHLHPINVVIYNGTY